MHLDIFYQNSGDHGKKGDNFLGKINTGNEMWFFCYKPKFRMVMFSFAYQEKIQKPFINIKIDINSFFYIHKCIEKQDHVYKLYFVSFVLSLK